MMNSRKESEKMRIERINIEGGDFKVPAVIHFPPESSGAAVIIHGYGGCKEEQLGLAWRVAESGVTTCTIDLRGHGEHKLPLNEEITLDVASAIQYCRSFGKVVAIGHSLGGRLALLSSADYIIAVSPALRTSFSPQTMGIIKEMRGYRVREVVGIFELFRVLPLYRPIKSSSVSFIYAERDVPEIKQACSELLTLGENVVSIDQALHSDIFLLEPTFRRIGLQIGEWL
jgi:hypothetical protein